MMNTQSQKTQGGVLMLSLLSLILRVGSATPTTTTTPTMITTPPMTTTPEPSTPTPPLTTTPMSTVPPGGCLYEGKIYANGDDVERDEMYNCYGMICDYGSVYAWDHQCFFYTPYCAGESERVLGQCCPVCNNITTTPPTTIPPTTTPPDTTLPGSCVYNGEVYSNGQEIYKDPNNCGGSLCQDGGILYWDDECAFYTPVCDGISERVVGQCCPICKNITTTPPTTVPTTTTTPTTVPQITTPPGSCFYNGKVFSNGEEIYRDANNCGGALCQDGGVMHWDDKCAFYTPVCNGVSERVKGQCCPVCHNVTTTVAPGCYVNGKLYSTGQRTNIDPCHVCLCTDNGTESCSNVTCHDVKDCDVKYRIAGECCYICGCSRDIASMFTVLVLLFASRKLQIS